MTAGLTFSSVVLVYKSPLSGLSTNHSTKFQIFAVIGLLSFQEQLVEINVELQFKGCNAPFALGSFSLSIHILDLYICSPNFSTK